MKYSILLLVFYAHLAAAVENSIVGLLDSKRLIQNIDAKKYSQNQYGAISEALRQKSGIIRIASYNMLFDRYDHLLPATYRWKARLTRLVDVIDDMHADLICFQELYPNQVKDLIEELDDEYTLASSIEGDDDDDDPPEINGILIRKGRFQCQKVLTWHISETTVEPLLDPDAKERKSVCEIHLTDWVSKKDLVVLCTHISFGSPDSREYAAKVLANYIEPLSKNKPVILAGDFNTFAARLDEPILPYYDGNYMLKILTSMSLRNAKDAALIGTMGPLSTYTNKEGALMPFQGTGTPGVFLDHIFTAGKVVVLLHAVQRATVDGNLPSSHMPVIVDCINFS